MNAGGQSPEVKGRDPRTRPPLANPGPLLIVISAPSGAGKTTLCRQLLAAVPGLARAVTCTTRSPRPGELEGVDYFFLAGPVFLERVQAGDFLEHASVFGHRYGTLKSEVLDRLRQGSHVLLNVDVQGARSVRERARQDSELERALVSIFLTPPSFAVLEQRLRKRGTDSPEVIEQRLGVARQEIAHWAEFDYLLTSDSIEEDLRRARAIIEAERMRSARALPPTL